MKFRFDDICINTDMDKAMQIANSIHLRFPGSEIIFAVSPLVHKCNDERVFPKEYTAMSDYRNFYHPTRLGVPKIESWITVASHGLIHVDHRLLNHKAQEMSILTSCSLVNSKIFVPPFNKWNGYTDAICTEHGIELVKFEDGWLSMEHNEFKRDHKLWYLHHRAFNMDKLNKWLS